MKYLLFAALIATCGVASAQSILLGRNLIGKGDSAAHTREAGGEPAQLDRIDADESSPAMEIWTYRQDDRVVTLWFVAGKVVKASEEKKNTLARSASSAGVSHMAGAN